MPSSVVRPRRRFPLMFRLVGGFFLLFAVVFIGGIAWHAFVGHREYAEAEAREWIANMYPEWQVAGISAMDRDTDGDGYVSVDVRIVNPDTKEERTIPLSAAAWNPIHWNRGAKERIAIPGVQNRAGR